MRANQLASNPLCAYCLSLGYVTAATIADHIKPHKGNPRLFWDTSNLQSLCKACHDSVKAREETIGQAIGCDSSGLPNGREW